MKILIATPLYPPDIGGPAQYALNLEKEFKKLGHEVRVVKFGEVKNWPSGVRHLLYFLKILPALVWCDWCLALDTFSVALPVVLVSKVIRRKVVIRTGGDFLWESYVERTGDLVLLRNSYQNSRSKWNRKEKIIFFLTRWVLNSALVVFSTDWQRQIWLEPYNLHIAKTGIIENYYGPKESTGEISKKNFIASTRKLKWKNKEKLYQAFEKAKKELPDLILDDNNIPYSEFIKTLSDSYAVILVSLGDISPNLILEAIRCNKPFILTKENGLSDRIKDISTLVDPENEDDITEKILWLSRDDNYRVTQDKIKHFTFTHTWKEIADEFMAIQEKL